jgi:hypothetical protein
MRCTPDQVIQFTPALISDNAAKTLEAILIPEKNEGDSAKRKRFPHSRSASSAHLGVNCAGNALQAGLLARQTPLGRVFQQIHGASNTKMG